MTDAKEGRGEWLEDFNTRAKQTTEALKIQWEAARRAFVLMTPERTAFDRVNVILKDFVEDVGEKPFDIALGLFILGSYYTPPPRLSTSTQVDPIDKPSIEFVTRSRKFMHFASAAYGWKMVIGLMRSGTPQHFFKAITNNEEGNRLALAHHCGIDPEKDIIHAKWTSEQVYVPGHYLAVDPEENTIVFAIRGTFDAKDVLTDLVCDYVDFMGGKAHRGMAEAAHGFAKVARDHLRQAKEQYPHHKIVITGHSLGGGTATLLSLLLRDEFPSIECFAFAPPPVMSKELADRCQGFVHSFVLGDDVVPRLCHGAAKDLGRMIKATLDQLDNKTMSVIQILFAGENSPKYVKNLFKELPPIIVEHVPVEERSERMILAGSVYFLEGLHPLAESSNVINRFGGVGEFKKTHPEEFTDILLSATMIADHMPDQYETAFDVLLGDKEQSNPQEEEEWSATKKVIVYTTITMATLFVLHKFIRYLRK